MVLFWCQIKDGGKRNGLLRSTIQDRQTASESKTNDSSTTINQNSACVLPEANPNPHLYQGQMTNCNDDN